MKTWLQTLAGSEFKIMRLQDAPPGALLCEPQRVVDWLRPQLATSVRYTPDVENMMVIALSVRRHAIGWQVITGGTLDTLLVHPREIFKAAIIMNAASIILAHNHPSGDPTPSEADIKVTRDLVRAGQTMRIDVTDHLVLGRPDMERALRGWSSLRELGYFA